jgi:hypothetical protein
VSEALHLVDRSSGLLIDQESSLEIGARKQRDWRPNEGNRPQRNDPTVASKARMVRMDPRPRWIISELPEVCGGAVECLQM